MTSNTKYPDKQLDKEFLSVNLRVTFLFLLLVIGWFLSNYEMSEEIKTREHQIKVLTDKTNETVNRVNDLTKLIQQNQIVGEKELHLVVSYSPEKRIERIFDCKDKAYAYIETYKENHEYFYEKGDLNE